MTSIKFIKMYSCKLKSLYCLLSFIKCDSRSAINYSELRLIRLTKLRIQVGYPAEDTPLRRRPLEKAVLRRALCKTRRILVRYCAQAAIQAN